MPTKLGQSTLPLTRHFARALVGFLVCVTLAGLAVGFFFEALFRTVALGESAEEQMR